ncbi:uncharacterized protein LOC131056780 [Cryptomeria japonica]|uniref:uncharacterized protein LOC131056780 n=1 Tax=Cryptomeria japonica TaxID=3369 RepID=UPI0027DA29A7|nr:uncharacterized protein LOC131056780 [Cryptomeria japonica]
MGTFFEDDDREGDGPLIRTQAELTLQNLLQKQLSTKNRLEQVVFEESTHNMRCIGHGFSGIGTLAQFRENEIQQKEERNCQQSSISLAHSQMFINDVKTRKRYGPDPAFFQRALEEEQGKQYANCLNQVSEVGGGHRNYSRHTEELEASLMRGKDKLKAISHLSAGESAYRKPLLNKVELSELCKGSTPQERARDRAPYQCKRSVIDVFSRPAPEVLDLHTYLEEKHALCKDNKSETSKDLIVIGNSEEKGSEYKVQMEVPNDNNLTADLISETEILSNKLSEDAIREIPGGKFSNYAPGLPSHILYIKNLSSVVKETDLVSLFIRFQHPGQKLLFRLMQQGRMKGQAFVTFPDTDTATQALQLINGFQLKGKPMVIQYGRKEVGNDKCTN